MHFKNWGLTVNYYADAMRRYFDFEGRASRTQYWLFSAVYLGILFIAALIDISIDENQRDPDTFFTSAVLLTHLVPSIAISVRRLHDINKSGWHLFLALIPLVGFIVVLIFMCTPTQTNEGPAQEHKKREPAGTYNQLHPTTESSLQQLEKIASLRASGAIDEEEFQQLKANVLTRVS